MQELPGVSGWEVCVHSSPSAGRKIISFWKTRKREAEGFDNEALRIRGRCFASGLWVKSQGVSSPCLGGSIHHSEDSTITCRWWHRQPQEMSTYLSKNIRIDEMPFFLLFFFCIFFVILFCQYFINKNAALSFWLLWTTGNTLQLLVSQTQSDHIYHVQWCRSLKSSTPEYVKDHKEDLTLGAHLVREWFWYFATTNLEFK